MSRTSGMTADELDELYERREASTKHSRGPWLIAAAPDLLAALTPIADQCRRLLAAYPSEIGPAVDTDAAGSILLDVGACRAIVTAVDRARGDQP